jgi:hypothetical protein
MERIPKDYTQRFGCRFYTRPALKEIYGLLARSSDEVRCEIGQYRIDNIDEIDTVDLESVDRISFSIDSGGFYGGMGVAIYPLSSTIRVVDDHDATGMGLAAQASAVISRLRRSPMMFLQHFGIEPHHIRFTDLPHRSTFWSRKKDEIILLVISGVSGAVLGNIDRLWTLAKALGGH